MNRVEQSRRQRHSRAPYTLILFALLLAPGLSREARAQWTQPDTQGNINNINPGNVGVGTTAPGSKLVVSSNAANPVAPQDGTVLHIIGTDALKTRVSIDSFGAVSGPSVTFRSARGTGAAPTATQAGDAIGIVYGTGYGATQFLTSPKPAMWMTASENWTDTAAGSSIFFNTVKNGTTTPVERLRISENGNVGIGTSNPATQLHLHGSSPQFMISGAATDQHVLVSFADTSGLKGYAGYTGANGSGSRYTGIINYGGDYLGLGTVNATPVNFFIGGAQTHVMAANGNVGLGMTTPAHRLDVAGRVNASSGLCIAGNCKTAWSEVSSQWTTSGANIYYAGGNVGIGTTAPANPLHVRATNVATMQVQAGSTYTGFLSAWEAGSVILSNNRDPRTGANYNQAVPGAQLTLGNTGTGQLGDLVYQSTSAGAVGVTTEMVRFTSAGNVGIGTSAPTERLHVVGNINVTGNINAKYQDVAEWVPSTQSLAAGTVVVLDTARSNHVVASSTSYDTRVAGVVSAQPGVLLGERGDGKLMVATTGRVKVRVDATRGPVRVGDLLVTSDVEGVAMKSEPLALAGRQLHLPGTLIGKALEPLEKGVGEILVLLSLQ